ncbi:hypothetical protein MTP99_000901 [Tenebrio molitor]|jgi:hypothetical protein|nr:hypothetical protein MTP99_000901 [Tenebrio molitor]
MLLRAVPGVVFMLIRRASAGTFVALPCTNTCDKVHFYEADSIQDARLTSKERLQVRMWSPTQLGPFSAITFTRNGGGVNDTFIRRGCDDGLVNF